MDLKLTITDQEDYTKILPKELENHTSLNYLLDGTEVEGGVCKGRLYWDIGLEGWCCTVCDASSSIK